MGIATVVAALTLFLMPTTNVGFYASAMGGILIVGLVVAMIQSAAVGCVAAVVSDPPGIRI